jgi:hypothetical protein
MNACEGTSVLQRWGDHITENPILIPTGTFKVTSCHIENVTNNLLHKSKRRKGHHSHIEFNNPTKKLGQGYNTAPQVRNFKEGSTNLKAHTVGEVRFGHHVPSAAQLFTQKSDLTQRFDLLYKTFLRDIDQHQEYWTTAWVLSELRMV